MKQSTFGLYYLLLGIVFIVLEHLNFFYPSVISKILIIPSLILFYHTEVRKKYNPFHRLVLTGLILSFTGDLAFYFGSNERDIFFSERSFIFMGFFSFLITLIIYSIAFNLEKGRHTIFRQRIFILIMLLGYGGLILWLLYNQIPDDLRTLIILYTVIIHIMVASALNRFGKVNGVSYMLVAIGAVLFLLSSSLLGINRFYERFDFARITIMATFIAAQYLIAIGCLKQDFDPK